MKCVICKAVELPDMSTDKLVDNTTTCEDCFRKATERKIVPPLYRPYEQCVCGHAKWLHYSHEGDGSCHATDGHYETCDCPHYQSKNLKPIPEYPLQIIEHVKIGGEIAAIIAAKQDKKSRTILPKTDEV